MITQVALSEFKQIIYRDCGLFLDDKTAFKYANDFLIALEAIVEPDIKKIMQGDNQNVKTNM
jgi:hypothetical protein